MSTPTTTPAARFTRTRARESGANPTTEFSALMRTVRDAGLLRRRRGAYLLIFGLVTLALAAVVVGSVLLGHSWYQLLMAGALGVVLTQYAFLAHETAHRQVFASGKANDVAALLLGDLVVGISYSWWMSKHNRHHAHPNTLGSDPDIERDFISFLDEDAAAARGPYAWFTRRQGYLFFPILVLEGLNLHLRGFRTVLGRGRVERRWVELSMLVLRNGGYLGILFVLFPPGLAGAFAGVQLAVFGVYMGASFAPNHKGMPILAHDSKADFLSRQVLTSRNISGGPLIDAFMGGLNYQVEHHLFPNMPRPNLKRAQVLVKDYCAEHGIAYTETTLPQSYGIVVRYLNRVGLAAGGDPFDCPAASSLGR